MRTKELQKWIDEQETPQQVLQEFTKMSEHLFEELLNEALEQPDIREAYQVWPKASRDEKAIRRYCQTPNIMGALHLQLPGKNDGNTASPNIINTTSLFRAARAKFKDEDRIVFYMEPVASRAGIELRYSGEMLTQYDWDVLQAITDLAEGRYNVLCRVKATDILNHLGRDIGGWDYNRLEKSLVRLAAASLYIKRTVTDTTTDSRSHRPKIASVIHFLNHMTWLRGEDVIFSLDRFYGYLNGYGYALVDWKKRCRLSKNELAKKLQVLFMGHSSAAQFHSIPKLIELSGYNETVTKFTEHLKSALQQLMEAQVIHSFWVSRPKRGSSNKKVVCVWLKGPPDKDNPIPPERSGTYYGPKR